MGQLKSALTVFGLLALLPFVANAGSNDDANAADLRCMVVSVYVMASAASSPDPRIQGAAAGMPMYFLGRLDGRNPTFDIGNGVLQQFKNMAPKDIEAERARCGAMLTDRGQELKEIGQRMKEGASR